MAERDALVVLDNAASEIQVRPLLPRGSRCVVIVTSRQRLSGLADARHLALDVLEPSESLDLLRRAAGAERISADVDSARRIAEQVGHLPLALTLVAAQIDTKPGWSLADHLERLVEGRKAGRLESGMDLPFTLSYESLQPEQQRMLRRLAIHPGRDCDVNAATALADCDVDAAIHTLHALVAVHLVTESRPGRFELHDLIRVFAASRARDEDSPSERRQALTRLFDHYRYVAAAAMDHYAPSRRRLGPTRPTPRACVPEICTRASGLAWLDAERTNLVAAAAESAEMGELDAAIDLSGTLAPYLLGGAHFADAVRLHGLAASAARGVDKAQALNNLGTAYWRLGEMENALVHFRDALAVGRRAGDGLTMGVAWNNLGNVSLDGGSYSQALAHYGQALEVSRQVNDRVSQARALGNLGIAHECLGHYEDALECQWRALAIYRQLKDDFGQITTQLNVGNIHYMLGSYDEARIRYEDALTLARQNGDRTHEARSLTCLGSLNERLDLHAEARQHHQMAIDIASEIGDRLCESAAMTGIGITYISTAQPSVALGYLSSALETARGIGYREGEAETLVEYGNALCGLGRFEDSLRTQREALRIANELSDRHKEGRAHEGAAHAAFLYGDRPEARNHLERARSIYLDLGAPEAERVLSRIRDITEATDHTSSEAGGEARV
jgi:tetratricopeptide (TPR) repeat protein